MVRRIFSVLCLLVVLSFVAGSVSAMPPGPQKPPPAPKPPARPYLPFLPERSSGAVQDGAVSAQTIALGKPGTAFRYTAAFGHPGQAYPDDNAYLNGPFGLTVSPAGQVYFAEQDGARLFAYDAGGSLLWRAGTAGLHDPLVTHLAYPNEVALGPGDTLWVADRDTLLKFDALTGEFMAFYQDDVAGFSQLRGVAFDKDGRLFVSDYDRHVIQIFTLDGDGSPVYDNTIGLEDYPDPGDGFFNNPTQVVLDSDKKLYVADSGNDRVQVCTEKDSKWTCSLYFSSDALGQIQLDHPYGLGIDSLNRIYIADTKNSRVLRCQLNDEGDTVCTPLPANDLECPVDVAPAAAAGNVLVSDWCTNSIREYVFDTGALVGVYKGQAGGTPYPFDTAYWNGPRGIKVDALGNIYVLEELGKRVFKLDKTGATVLWSNAVWTGSQNDPINPKLPHNLSLDKAGNVLVSGPGPHVYLFDGKTGQFMSDLVLNWSEMPSFAGGTAVDAAGNVYVSDVWGQRVLVFNKLNQLVRQIGTGDCTPGNDGFCWPQGLAVDRLSNLYVADAGNCRVQKFNKLGVFVMTFSTQKCGAELDSLNGPADVAVDGKGNVYAVDTWNNRVQVYNPAGAYLTTLGGAWGGQTGRLRSPAGVAVDAKGLVYVADSQGHRIVKYTPGVPYAAPISINGFGKQSTVMVSALAPFKGQLFAGATAYHSYGAQIWRQTKTGWEAVMNDAFESEGNFGINTLAEYRGFLYAGTENCYDQECVDSDGAEIYRSPDGLTWQPVMTGGFDDTGNIDVFRILPLSGQVCAATYSAYHGAEIWCSPSGDPGSWVREVEDGLQNTTNEVFTTLQAFNGALYAGTMNREDGAEIYRKVGAEDWELVKSAGFGDNPYSYISAMTVFKGYLYTALSSVAGEPTRVYRCQACDDGDWELVTGDGFGVPGNYGPAALEATATTLYAVFSNDQSGLEVRKTTTGTAWTPVVTGGFGSSSNEGVYLDNSVTLLKNILYIGTKNLANGGGVWKVCAGASCK